LLIRCKFSRSGLRATRYSWSLQRVGVRSLSRRKTEKLYCTRGSVSKPYKVFRPRVLSVSCIKQIQRSSMMPERGYQLRFSGASTCTRTSIRGHKVRLRKFRYLVNCSLCTTLPPPRCLPKLLAHNMRGKSMPPGRRPHCRHEVIGDESPLTIGEKQDALPAQACPIFLLRFDTR
jgi:hypothetical protein